MPRARGWRLQMPRRSTFGVWPFTNTAAHPGDATHKRACWHAVRGDRREAGESEGEISVVGLVTVARLRDSRSGARVPIARARLSSCTSRTGRGTGRRRPPRSSPRRYSDSGQHHLQPHPGLKHPAEPGALRRHKVESGVGLRDDRHVFQPLDPEVRLRPNVDSSTNFRFSWQRSSQSTPAQCPALSVPLYSGHGGAHLRLPATACVLQIWPYIYQPPQPSGTSMRPPPPKV